MFFITRFLRFLTDRFYKVRERNQEVHGQIILPDYTDVIKFFEMTLNSKHTTEKQKTNRETKI